MPKLSGSIEKQLFGYQVDKENSEVFFNDEKHLYLDKLTGEPYISVTTLVGNYTNPFNESFMSKYKALEELADYDHFSLVKPGLLSTQIFNYDLLDKFKIDRAEFEAKAQEYLDTWHSTRDEACDHGTWVHSLMENSFYGKTHFDLSSFDCPTIVGDYNCVKGYYPKKLENGIYPEYLVSWISPEGLRISGQIDLCVCNNDEVTIIDWKTNREIKKRSYFNSARKKNVMMKYPLNDLMDSNYYHYLMQLSTYGYMIEQLNSDKYIKELKLVHIDRNGKQTIYPLEYKKDDVERMIHHYAKSLKTKELLDRDKPFIS